MRTHTRLALAMIVAGVAGLLMLRTPLSAHRIQQQDPATEPFKGVTTNGTVQPGLYSIKRTGVSTGPVRTAAEQFLAFLTAEQRSKTMFPVDDSEWRRWNNVHRYNRAGVSFREMSEAQREKAFALMRAGLSAKGLERSRNVMKLNGHLAALMNNFDEYGDDLYNLTVMGTPSATEPWGWQLDGHHLIINYFVLGDQVVMSPAFWGSEPISATEGTYAGISLFQDEQRKGLAVLLALSAEQRRAAIIDSAKVRNNALGQAFRDNLVVDYAGARASTFSAAQKALLLDVIGEFVGNMADGHARVRMEEVRAHLNDTYFAWVGTADPNGVFYYRIHSPVILIEFDHQTPVALGGPGGTPGRGGRGSVPTRQHIHTVVRTPNGNDYGKDLLRQHLAARHAPQPTRPRE